jgi:hypothetical protein
MLVVVKEETVYGHDMGDQVRLCCSHCRRRFARLEEAFLAYEAQAGKSAVEARWCHKRCVAGEATVKMVRGDWAMRRLLEALLTPPITRALRKDLPHAKRPWGNP